jgi:hypothetical protein
MFQASFVSKNSNGDITNITLRDVVKEIGYRSKMVKVQEENGATQANLLSRHHHA